jgi:hypothetical protein
MTYGCIPWVLHVDLSVVMTAAGVGAQWCFLLMASSISSIIATMASQRHDVQRQSSSGSADPWRAASAVL